MPTAEVTDFLAKTLSPFADMRFRSVNETARSRDALRAIDLSNK